MTNIRVVSQTQRIVVDPATGSISITNAGPPGPMGVLPPVVSLSSDVADDLLRFNTMDSGDTTDTSVRVSEDGTITARNFVSRLRNSHFYGNNPDWVYEEGDPFFKTSDYGNIFGGPNPWVGEDADGSPRGLKRDGSGVSGQPPFQTDLLIDLHADSSWLGRRWFVGDTNDPVDAVIQRSDGPASVVSGGSLGSPYVIGWSPIDIPVASLGTSAALSGWGTRGKAGVHRRLVFDSSDAFEHLQANNFTYEGLDFGSPHKLTGCVGERYTVLNSVVLNTSAGQDVIIEYTGFRNESKGRLIKDGGSVSFTRQSIGNTTYGGVPAKKFTGCLASSGTITLNPGDHIFVYFKFGDTENLKPVIDPQPEPALPGELPSWWSNSKSGVGIGRIAWRGLCIPPGGVSGVDAATAWSPYLASIFGEAAEDLFTNAAAGRISFRTNPYGGTGNLVRATIEPQGQVKALGGFSLGEPKELATGANLNNATPSLGKTGQYSYTNVSPLEYDIVIGAGMSIAVNTTTVGDATHNEVQTFVITGGVAGDQYAVRFNGQTSAPIDYDTDLTAGHNAAAAAVFKAALESLPSSFSGDFAVTRSVAGGVTTFTVTFGSLLTSSGSRFKVTNTAPTTITNFVIASEAAIEGQLISLRFMNTNTTIKHNNTGAGKIWLKDAQDRAMILNETLLLIYDESFQGFFEIGAKVRLNGLTANRALVSDASGVATASATVSDTELGYLDGVTSAIQTQLDAKIAKTTLDANSVLGAITDDTPVPIAMAASTILARLASGNVVAATTSQIRTLLSLVVGTDVQAYDANLAALAALTSPATTLGAATDQRLWLPCKEVQVTTGSPSFGSLASQAGVLLLDGAGATEAGAFTFVVPDHWQTMAIDVHWANAGAGTGDVRWTIGYLIVADGGDFSAALTTANVTATAGAQNIKKVTNLATGISLTTARAGTMVLTRTSSDAADTLTNDVGVVGLVLRRLT